MQRVKKEIAKRLEQPVGMNLTDENLVNCRVHGASSQIYHECV
jgi:hypothetical protein